MAEKGSLTKKRMTVRTALRKTCKEWYVKGHNGHAQIFGDGKLVHPLGIPDFFHSEIVDWGMHISKLKARTASIKSDLITIIPVIIDGYLVQQRVWIEILIFYYKNDILVAIFVWFAKTFANILWKIKEAIVRYIYKITWCHRTRIWCLNL